jgi:fluoroacetyl-CoA thioesterase
MEVMTNLPEGARLEHKLLVTSDIAIDFLGVAEARVLGTPWLIAHLEWTARNLAKPYLDPGQDTVGTTVNVRHLASSPLGTQVTFRAIVKNVDGRRVMFDVEAEDEFELVAQGTHERFIIDIDRFAARVREKAERKRA